MAVFLVDCFDDASTLDQIAIDVRKLNVRSAYARTQIAFCLQGIQEYTRLMMDLHPSGASAVVVATGPVVQAIDSADLLRSQIAAGKLTKKTIAQAIQLACRKLITYDDRRLIVLLRHQPDVPSGAIVPDDHPAGIDIAEAIQLELCSTGNQILQCDLTIVRLVAGADNLTGPVSACRTVGVRDLGGEAQFPITVTTFLIRRNQTRDALSELAQRHLHLRSIKVDGIPMKKSKKQQAKSGSGLVFTVSFLFVADKNDAIMDFAKDRAEIVSGSVALGSSPWLARRQQTVVWSHLPPDSNINTMDCSSVRLVTPADLMSPLTLPLMKCVLVPGNTLAFTSAIASAVSHIIVMHGSHIYLHIIRANSPVVPVGKCIQVDDPLALGRFVDIVHMCRLRSNALSNDDAPSNVACLNQLTRGLVSGRTSVIWKHCSPRMSTILKPCVQELLHPKIPGEQVNNMQTLLSALFDATARCDLSFLPSELSPADAKTAFATMWNELLSIGRCTKHWSRGHYTVCSFIEKFVGRLLEDSSGDLIPVEVLDAMADLSDGTSETFNRVFWSHLDSQTKRDASASLLGWTTSGYHYSW